jgi:hypothetical protein
MMARKVEFASKVIIASPQDIADEPLTVIETEQHLNNMGPIVLPNGQRVHLRFHFGGLIQISKEEELAQRAVNWAQAKYGDEWAYYASETTEISEGFPGFDDLDEATLDEVMAIVCAKADKWT